MTGGALARDGQRRAEILDTAASIFASSGFAATSLRDIAEACGIVAGSLYHHFDSKETIAVELIDRYLVELAAISDAAMARLRSRRGGSVPEQLREFMSAIADCALRNPAAIELMMYEPYVGAGQKFVDAATQRPHNAPKAMAAILRKGRSAGSIRPDVDPTAVANLLRLEVTRIGLRPRSRGAAAAPDALWSIAMNGVARNAPSATDLDGSAAKRAASDTIAGWAAAVVDLDRDDRAHIRAVARQQFARRGYEATTMREIATEAGVTPRSIYRRYDSKELILEAIMDDFYAAVLQGYGRVLASTSDVIEKLDALVWLNTNVLERFPEEVRIQQAWLRVSPPDASRHHTTKIRERSRRVTALLNEGIEAGELRPAGTSTSAFIECMHNLVAVPAAAVDAASPDRSLAAFRETVLVGIAPW